MNSRDNLGRVCGQPVAQVNDDHKAKKMNN